MEYFLRQIVHDNNRPVEIQLESNEKTIGRCITDLVEYKQVSRNHAKLHKVNDKWFIKDLNSVNGVYINQLKITKEEELQIGDHIGLGIDNPSIGFVCALSVRAPVVKNSVVIKKEPIEVIELSDDDDCPPIKIEQPSKSYDGQGCSWNPVDCNPVPLTYGKRESLASKPVNSSLLQESVQFNKEKVAAIKNISFFPINQNLIPNPPSSNSISNLGVEGNSLEIPTQETVSLQRLDEVKPVIQKKNVFPGLKLISPNHSAVSSTTPSALDVTQSNFCLPSPSPDVKAFSVVKPAIEAVSNHKIRKVEQAHQKSNVPSLKLKNSNLSASAYEAPYRNPKSQPSTSSDFKTLSPRTSAQDECPVPKRNEFIDKRVLKKPSVPSLNVVSSSLTVPSTSNVFPAYSVLKNCESNSTHDIPYKNPSCGVRSQSESSDRSSVQSPTIRPKKENCHLVETSFGTLNSACSYLTQNPIDRNMKDNLMAAHNNLIVLKECCVKLKRCDEAECENDSAEELRFNVKRRRISSDSDEENAPYSQVEEVIIINSDDDDDYYDFNPSQVVVKTEPMDEEELEVNDEPVAVEAMDDINSKLIHSHENNQFNIIPQCHNLPKPSLECNMSAMPENFPESRLSCDNDDKMTNKEISCSETVEDVRKFIEVTRRSSLSELTPVKKPTSDNVRKAISSEDVEKNVESDSSRSSHDDIIIPSKLKAKLKPPVQKSSGRTLPTAPKPMTQRPRCRRGREEWFSEKRVNSPPKQPEKGSKPKPKKSPLKNTIPNRKNLKDFKIPKKARLEGNKTPDKVRTSVLSAVEAPVDKNYSKAGGTSSIKKKAPAIARKPGKPSRSEILASEPQVQPRKSAAKPHASPPKKAVQPPSHNSLPNRNHGTETLLKKTSNSETKPKYVAPNNNQNNTRNQRVHFAKNLPPEPKFTSDPRVFHPLTSSGNYNRLNNTYQPNVSNPQVLRDPRLNRANQQQLRPTGNLAPVYPAGDRFISDPMDVQESNMPLKTNPYLSKYGSIVSNPVTGSKADTGLVISPFSRELLINKIVKLNTKWLEEQNVKANSLRLRGRCPKVKPPPDVMENASPVPLSFNSLEEYVNAFTPLLLLEIWDFMCDSWREYQSSRKFYFEIVGEVQRHGMKEYVCESIVNDMSYAPVRGSIVILNIRADQKVQPIFGFVHDLKVVELGRDYVLRNAWKKSESRWLQDGKLYKFTVYVKDRSFLLSQNLLMKGSGLCNIGNKVSLMDNFLHLSRSPLSHYILSPTDKGFFTTASEVIAGREYNYHQMVAITSICKEITIKGPKIMLLQGPPGTGKSHTLIGLLEKMIFCRASNRRILVVAPSNAAIDVIGQRLIQLNQRSHRGIMRFVRVGVPNQIGKALQPYTLDSKLKEILDKEIQSKREEIKRLQEDIKKLQKQNSYEANLHIKEIEAKIAYNTKRLTMPNKNTHSHKMKILTDCNIILSTLGSCNQYILTSTFRPDSYPFSCVIVDEAAQCTELELLQTMAFRTSKLVLVGDHNQLPATVLSDHAKEYGFERSMFERLYICLTEKYHGSNPAFMLKEQFRMHPDICAFPSKHFYQNKLSTSPSVLLRDEKLFQNTFQQPYFVLDILESEEYNKSCSKTNCNEAHVVVKICEQLLALRVSLSIGVITPYQGQCSLYTNAFKNHPDYSQNIEVNTVDGFQGQEKDVIILSCVRANKNGGIGFLACRKRLNVAITRARRLLIICGCLDTLTLNHDWMALIDDARERKIAHSVISEKDISLLFQTYVRK